MKKLVCFFLSVLTISVAWAQKKPLDHTVYDGWQSIGERAISNDGKFVVYTITPQEGDATLVIQQTGGKIVLEVPRGYQAKISADSRFVVFKIKPTFQQTREAKIKKKKADDMPKDSLGLFDVTASSLEKLPRVKSFKLAEESAVWLAWLHEKGENEKKEEEAGTLLIVKNLVSGTVDSIKNISEYVFDKKGVKLVLEMTAGKKDKLKSAVVNKNLAANTNDTVLTNFADAKGYVFNETGNQLAFFATNDTSKTEQKKYTLYRNDASTIYTTITDQSTNFPTGWRVNENSNIIISDDGSNVFFGLNPVLPAKDTSLPEFERVSVDVWNYKDEQLQTVQLKNADTELKRSYWAIWQDKFPQVLAIGNKTFNQVYLTAEGKSATPIVYLTSDEGKRVAAQWQGFTLKDIYVMQPTVSNERRKITSAFKGNMYPSVSGNYLLTYDEVKRKYNAYEFASNTWKAVAKDIKFPLWDEENDVPEDPNPYGVAKWMQGKDGKEYVLIYDKYDVWKVDPRGITPSVNLTNGRKNKLQYRNVNLNPDEKVFKEEDGELYLRVYNELDKTTGLNTYSFVQQKEKVLIKVSASTTSNFIKAKEADVIAFSKESFQQSPNLCVFNATNDVAVDANGAMVFNSLSNLNPQQAQYNWGTAELFTWKAYGGKLTEGVLYKPEDFNPNKKYPMIVYFYERNNQTLHNYLAPAPTPSRLNISFFVSRGYIVFVPDIWYKKGYPGQGAYDYIVSGTRAVVKQGFVDSTKIGLQGQSWGGYQIAHLITRTKLYAAAWAGAPVVNMFSAYGGIRWESGLNRQFQYEKSQSRIGATPWERRDLYVENSPFFHLPKVTTPLVIMANDADGAVPWYQGIEMFTAMRRLNKPVWMLNYNGEAHNLVERRNRKDIQIREQQFFDWLLKGEKPATWLTDGVPAVMKGRTWGLD